MKYKNKLIEVLKSTILLTNDTGLFSKKYDNNIYPESNTYEDIIKTLSPDFIVNSDSIFDRPKTKEVSSTIINTSKIKNRPSIKYIESNIKKNINILPTNFNKILKNTENSIQNTDKDTSEYIISNKHNLGHNTSQQEPVVSSRESFDPIGSPVVSSRESFDPIGSPVVSSKESFSTISPKQESIPDLYISHQEPVVSSRESFDAISPKQESIPDLYTSQQEPVVSSKESFDPISSKQESIPELYVSQQEPVVSSRESFSPIGSPVVSSGESFDAISSKQESIPELYASQQEPVVSSRESFDAISSKQESIPELYASQQEPVVSSRESFSPIENSIIPNNFSFPVENQEFKKNNNLYYNNLNSTDKLKSNVFERKLRNGKYYPDITEVNRIKRNLFTDIVGNGLIQSNLNKELQEISAFKYGGTVDPTSPTFMTNEGNVVGRGTENVSTTIIPENTPNPSISRTPGYSDNNTSLDPETESEIAKSLLSLNKKIKKLNQQMPPKQKKALPKPFKSNQVRGHNNSIMIYYNSFG